ncbi:hypothetical protein [Enterobacter hormaechei]|uniref:hypothetical protein n=1 Tax=Enterobacter hormaechei TaxID=158836 RepID=UPI00146371B2|nr:hypothetical protein [Enterobacter hormaechei]QJQ17124.1 hypothetical protein D6T76_17420 [Enterobacter hormaechei]
MSERYRHWFTMVLQDATSKGGMGRCLLASQTAFFYGVDEAWTRQYIIPLFSDPDQQKFVQVWDGFLMWGRLYPALVEALLPAFLPPLYRDSLSIWANVANDLLNSILFSSYSMSQIQCFNYYRRCFNMVLWMTD